MQSEEQFLSLSMYTYLDLVKQGERVIQFIEQALELVKPWCKDLRLQPWYPGGTPGHISSLTQRTQRRVYDQLQEGGLESLIIAQQDWENYLVPPQVRLHLKLASYVAFLPYQNLRYPTLPGEYNDQSVARTLNLTINRDLLGVQSHLQLFDSLADLGLWTVEVLDAVYGFISVGDFGRVFGGYTSYEERHSLDYTKHVRHALRDKSRGVFHVNFLTEGHIAALGDITSLASLPAVTGVQSARIRDRDVLILRVGEPQASLDDTQVQAVEERMKPILPQRPVEIMVDLIDPEVAPELEGAIPQLEALLSPSQIMPTPNGGVLVFYWHEKSHPNPQQQMEMFRRLAVLYQEQLGSIPWSGPVFGDIHPGWRLYRIGKLGNHLNRMPYISCSSLIDVEPFEMTLWLGSPPAKRVERALRGLFTEWAGFQYPGYPDDDAAIDILDVRFEERAVVVRAEIRAHRGFALATLISMLDRFALKQARIDELVLGQIEDLESLLAEAGCSYSGGPTTRDGDEKEVGQGATQGASDRATGIQIVIGDLFEPPDIHLTIQFAYPPDEAQQVALTELLEAWYLTGANEGFGPGFFHSASSLIFDEEIALWYVDIGSASSSAIDALRHCLEGYSEAHVPIREVVLGTRLDG